MENHPLYTAYESIHDRLTLTSLRDYFAGRPADEIAGEPGQGDACPVTMFARQLPEIAQFGDAITVTTTTIDILVSNEDFRGLWSHRPSLIDFVRWVDSWPSWKSLTCGEVVAWIDEYCSTSRQ